MNLESGPLAGSLLLWEGSRSTARPGPTGFCRFEGQPEEVRLTRMLGSTGTFLRVENFVGVDFLLEPGQERGPARFRMDTSIDLRMESVGGELGSQRTFGWR